MRKKCIKENFIFDTFIPTSTKTRNDSNIKIICVYLAEVKIFVIICKWQKIVILENFWVKNALILKFTKISYLLNFQHWFNKGQNVLNNFPFQILENFFLSNTNSQWTGCKEWSNNKYWRETMGSVKLQKTTAGYICSQLDVAWNVAHSSFGVWYTFWKLKKKIFDPFSWKPNVWIQWAGSILSWKLNFCWRRITSNRKLVSNNCTRK